MGEFSSMFNSFSLAALLQAEGAQPLVEVAADGVHVFRAGEVAARPTAGAGVQGPQLVGFGQRAEGAPHSSTDQGRTRSAGGAGGRIQQRQFFVAEVDLCACHAVMLHRRRTTGGRADLRRRPCRRPLRNSGVVARKTLTLTLSQKEREQEWPRLG